MNSQTSKTVQDLSKVLSEEYFLLLKTLNFHWNVEGPLFHSLHTLFETHYRGLLEKVDDIAETIRAYDAKAPGSFREYSKTSLIDEAPAEEISAIEMVEVLNKDHLAIAARIKEHHEDAEAAGDIHAVTLYEDLITFHEKAAWMIRSHLPKEMGSSKQRKESKESSMRPSQMS